MRLSCPLVLASASPRRRILLRQLGLAFEVHASGADETLPPGTPPEDAVRRLALQKASDVAAAYPDALVIGADTIVVLDGEILNKPLSVDDACAMLGRLAARKHDVYTGVALLHASSGRRISFVERTAVTFGSMSMAEIEAYVATGSPMDKAGSYGIQDDLGAAFIQRIEGDYYAVVGLPLHRLYRALTTDFADLVAQSANQT